MIAFMICLILAIIAVACFTTGSLFLIIIGADLIVCAGIIWKIISSRKRNK